MTCFELLLLKRFLLFFCSPDSYNIDQHDYSVRMRAAKKFLKDGDKVKVIVNMKGRENEFRNIAIELLRRFQTEIGEVCTVLYALWSFLGMCIAP